MLEVRELTSGSLVGHLYRLALPIMGTSFVQMAYSFTDMAWLGRLSSEAVASVGVISVFMWIACSLASFNKTASEVCIAQSIGRGEMQEAKVLASHNTSLAVLLAILLMLIYGVFAGELVDLYHLTDAVRTDALSYLYICLWGMPAIFLTYALFGIYNATGNSHIPFGVMSVGLVCNMLLDPLLIHYLGWGVEGAAWATVISQYLVLGIYIYRYKCVDVLLGGFALFVKMQWGLVLRIAKIGLPASMLNVCFAVIAIAMGRITTSVGGDIGVAVMTTGGQLEALTWSTAQGATTALSTIVAQNYAAGLRERVYRAYALTLCFTSLVGLLGMLYFVFDGEGLFALIVPDRATFTEGGVYLRISGYSQVLMMVELATQGLFYGMGRSYLPASISVLGNVLRIPLALALVGLGWGLSGVWWAISLSAMLKGLVALIALALSLYRNRDGVHYQPKPSPVDQQS